MIYKCEDCGVELTPFNFGEPHAIFRENRIRLLCEECAKKKAKELKEKYNKNLIK